MSRDGLVSIDGTFKDRELLTHRVELLLDGMAGAGMPVGATKGFIYLRAEYPLLVAPLRAALAARRASGLLGGPVVVPSVTEGVDKPLKYRVMFRKADLVVVTKIDLLPHLPDVSLTSISENVARVMPAPEVIALSATTDTGIEAFVAWIDARRAAFSLAR